MRKVSWVSCTLVYWHVCVTSAGTRNTCKVSRLLFLSFGLKDGYEAGVRFYDALQIFKRLVNIGDAKSLSLALSPCLYNTHRQLSEAEQKQAGVSPAK
ncbi:PLP-dependent transferase [Vibrio lentus]|nr:PLP-dependent transferase [Vibrio lentus]